MKWNWKLELPQIILVVGMLLWAALAWQSTPERVPVHWNAAGEVNGWGGRFMGVLLVPLIGLGLYLLLRFIPLLDPGKANYAKFAGPYAVVRISIMVMLAGIYVATQFSNFGVQVPMGRIMPLMMGAMFIAMGSVLGKVRPNWFVGVRTPWTLSSKVSWVKTHRLAGFLFTGTGIASMLSGLLLPPQACFIILMVGAMGSAFGTMIYSYFAWRSDPDKIPPAGTLPAEDPPGK